MTAATSNSGLTVRDVAKLFRVSPDKVRAWISKGELPAVNTSDALCRKPRFVILPHQLAEFAARRQVALPPKKVPRRQKRTAEIDFYP